MREFWKEVPTFFKVLLFVGVVMPLLTGLGYFVIAEKIIEILKANGVKGL